METPNLDKESKDYAYLRLGKHISTESLELFKTRLLATITTRLDALGMFDIRTKTVRVNGIKNILKSMIHFDITDDAINEVINILEEQLED